MRSPRRIPVALGAGALVALFAAQTASAHIEIEQPEVTAGSQAVVTLQVPHGCAGSTTTELRISIPESITDVTPTRNANWNVNKVTEALATPVTDEDGGQITERVTEVDLAMTISADAAGTTLYFPTIQTCEQGETPWIDVPSAGQSEDDLEHPAPSVAVVAPGPDATDDHHD